MPGGYELLVEVMQMKQKDGQKACSDILPSSSKASAPFVPCMYYVAGLHSVEKMAISATHLLSTIVAGEAFCVADRMLSRHGCLQQGFVSGIKSPLRFHSICSLYVDLRLSHMVDSGK